MGIGEMILMVSNLTRVQDLRELAKFLAHMNKQKSFHIGYCGEEVEEIHKTLNEDFVLEDGQISFHIARDDHGEIEFAIGFDIDGASAEVWGPYNTNFNLNEQLIVWEQMTKEYQTIETYSFFLNKENLKQQEFMNAIHARKTGEHLILEINKQNFKAVQIMRSTDFIPTDLNSFVALHEVTFPNTYYSAQTIVNRLNNDCNLKVLKSESNEMLGYVYYEMDLELKEATIHYFAISPIAQNQGYGTMLLKEAITEIFSYPEISEIQLCV